MKNFFYHMSKDRYFISDLEFCSESDHTFDTTFNDLANNEKLLNVLWLYYMQGNYGVRYTMVFVIHIVVGQIGLEDI